MSGEEALREALNGALKDTQRQHGWVLATGILADALLPVVLRYGREKAAAELRRMADWIDGEAGATTAVWLSLGVRNRADALTAQDPTEDGAR